MRLSDQEVACGKVAMRLVAEQGGFVTFEEYDRLMRGEHGRSKYVYFPPINWVDGWGWSHLYKANNDKKCAFAAVIAGFLEQTPDGYRLAGDDSETG